MDTTIIPQHRIVRITACAVSIGISTCLLLVQNFYITARGTDTGEPLAAGINYIVQTNTPSLHSEDLFNKEISQKYTKGTVTEVEKGVKHVRMIRYYNNRPVRINIVELSKDVNESLVIEPAIASNTLASKSKIANIAKRENAIVAINGGYFKPQTGVPLGTLMINGKMYTGPIYDRVALGFFDNGYGMARVQLKASVYSNLGGIKIDNVNQPRMLSTHTIVYTPEWGKISPPSPKYGMQIAISGDKLVKSGTSQMEIPSDGYVIVGPAKNLSQIAGAKRFKLNIKMNPEWNGVNHIISGGPYLIKGGNIYVDMTAQKLSSIGGRNPRTAIGYTKDNHLIMLTADGREGSSIGLTLNELASLMKEYGCVEAMNLDGGGSTVMYIKGQVVNRPAVQGGIPLSHTLTVSKKIT